MDPMERSRARWRGEDAGAHYAGARWRSAAKKGRDPARIAALLARHLPARGPAEFLDAPCGTGRLFAALEARGRVVGLDVSPAMLQRARAVARADTELLLGDLARLPFAGGSFDAVVCCRLLHHLEREQDLARVVAELVRVSRGLVVVTYWDAAALPAWRRRLLPSRRSPRRFARARAELEALFEQAGATIVARAWSLRFVSRQAYLVARRRP